MSVESETHLLPGRGVIQRYTRNVNGSIRSRPKYECKSRCFGAEGGIRTPTPYGATPSRWCVCQFRHFRTRKGVNKSEPVLQRSQRYEAPAVCAISTASLELAPMEQASPRSVLPGLAPLALALAPCVLVVPEPHACPSLRIAATRNFPIPHSAHSRPWSWQSRAA